jgi:hypothetical protein
MCNAHSLPFKFSSSSFFGLLSSFICAIFPIFPVARFPQLHELITPQEGGGDGGAFSDMKNPVGDTPHGLNGWAVD